jgi:benzoate/toluate 1,2-dioxygenase beta subunit
MSTLGSLEAAEFVYREGLLLDQGEFDAWVDLFTPDCRFWMPAWRDDGTQTEDPDRELSLIYYKGRKNLEDRLQRIRSGFSVASAVLPRYSHLIGSVLSKPLGEKKVRVDSAFTVNVYDVRVNRTHSYFGRYEHELVKQDGEWKIASKVIRLINDVVPTMLDVYSI